MQLSINNIDICYGNHTAVQDFSLSLEVGEIGCLLGHSGCGKTTVQRAIAGFEPITNGNIELGGQLVSSPSKCVNPEKRHVGMVFQDFALFPHLTIEKNIAFGISKLPTAQIRSRVTELLALVGLEGSHAKYPHELSGGQQQRVALARAIAPKPNIILLDEPFSSLDASLRESLAKEVRNLLREYKITAILVTHDQQEAFAFADKVGVMAQGKLLQWGSPYELYHKPSSRRVANFIGEGNFISAKTNSEGDLENGLGNLGPLNKPINGHHYQVLIRPDDLIYFPQSETSFKIIDKTFRGAEYLYELELPDQQIVCCVTPSHVNYSIGEHLPVKADLKHVITFREDED